MSRNTSASLLIPSDLEDELNEKFPSLKETGRIHKDHLGEVFKMVNFPLAGHEIRKLLDDNLPGAQEISRESLFMLYAQVKEKKDIGRQRDPTKVLRRASDVRGGAVKEYISQKDERAKHSVEDSESRGYAGWINRVLKDDPDLKNLLPLDVESDDLYSKLKDGTILCKLINSSVPNTIDEKALNKGDCLKSVFKRHENLSLAVNSAAAIGCCVVNVGAEDLAEGKPHLSLGVIWQVIRIGLLKEICIKDNPQLAALLLEGETLQDLRRLSPEEILIRWVNYHLQRAGCTSRINNFKEDIMNSEAYAYLLQQIAPEEKRYDLASVKQILSSSDNLDRARNVWSNAEMLDAALFVIPEDIAFANEKGKNREKLNLAFVANLFNTYPALELVDALPEIIETLEEKTYRNWMNSLGVNPFVTDLYTDLRDGLVLLQLFDIMQKGIVSWDKIYKEFKKGREVFQMQANCNFVIQCGQKCELSLVAVGAEDICSGNDKLTLGLVFQMMRHYTLLKIKECCKSESNKKVDDNGIIAWTNDRLKQAGKSTSIKSFRDPIIANSDVILDLIDAIVPQSINYKIASEIDDKLAKARYAISMGRRMGARIYALPEHIVDVNKNMVMTIFACLMIAQFTKAKA